MAKKVIEPTNRGDSNKSNENITRWAASATWSGSLLFKKRKTKGCQEGDRIDQTRTEANECSQFIVVLVAMLPFLALSSTDGQSSVVLFFDERWREKIEISSYVLLWHIKRILMECVVEKWKVSPFEWPTFPWWVRTARHNAGWLIGSAENGTLLGFTKDFLETIFWIIFGRSVLILTWKYCFEANNSPLVANPIEIECHSCKPTKTGTGKIRPQRPGFCVSPTLLASYAGKVL